MSPVSHASGSAARLVTALHTPWLPFQRAPPAPVGEGRLWCVSVPHSMICPCVQAPLLLGVSERVGGGTQHKSGEGAPHQAGGGGGHLQTSPVAVGRGCVAGPVPALCSAPGLPLHTEVFQGADGSHSCITPGACAAPPGPRD